MKALRTGLVPLLTALVLAGCGGGDPCGTAAERDSFRTVSAHLHRDGREYAVFSGAEARAACARTLENWERDLWEREDVPHSRKLLLQRRFVTAKLLIQLAGLDQLRGAGWSAKTLAGNRYGHDFIHSRAFLALPGEKPGALNGFFLPDDPLNLPEFLGALPRETDFAVAAALDPGAALEALKQAGSWGENLALELAENFPLREIFKDLRGTWKFVQVTLPGRGESDFMLELPDNSGALRRLPEPERLALFPGSRQAARDHGVTIYSSPQAEKFFTSADRPKMRDRTDFATLLRALPEQVCCAVYQDRGFSLTDELTGVGPGAAGALPALVTISRAGEGMLIAGNGDCGVLELLFRAAAKLLNFPRSEEDAAERTPAPAQPPSESPCDCVEALELLRKVPKPSAKPGMPGLRECFNGEIPAALRRDPAGKPDADNCKIVYFGHAAQADLPLAVSRPSRHPDRFHVLFNDGRIRTFMLDRPDSCRRIVSFLHTEKRWEETVWRRLMRLAEALDSGAEQ